MRSRSLKTQQIYLKRRIVVAEMLRDHPYCMIRWDKRCQMLATCLHERKKRSQGGSILDKDNCVPSCGPCNSAIEDYPAEAHRRGFVIRRGDEA